MTINRREAAIISAYTGIMFGDFDEMHAVIEEAVGRPVMTHEMASQQMSDSIKVMVLPMFLRLDVESTRKPTQEHLAEADAAADAERQKNVHGHDALRRLGQGRQ